MPVLFAENGNDAGAILLFQVHPVPKQVPPTKTNPLFLQFNFSAKAVQSQICNYIWSTGCGAFCFVYSCNEV